MHLIGHTIICLSLFYAFAFLFCFIFFFPRLTHILYATALLHERRVNPATQITVATGKLGGVERGTLNLWVSKNLIQDVYHTVQSC